MKKNKNVLLSTCETLAGAHPKVIIKDVVGTVSDSDKANANRITLEFVDIDGNVLYSYTTPIQTLRLILSR
ncbi:MAG: hypothetical protein WAS34_18800 [Thiolinea sp.]